MARWRLLNPHYLNVPGIEWEQKETNRDTGRQVTRKFSVPLLLQPNEPSDCNYPGEIIVCSGEPTPAFKRDIQFLGEPTPDMEPVDEEAEKISESLKHKWVHPIDTLPANGDYGAALIATFEKQIQGLSQGQNVSNKSVSSDDFAKLQAQVAALMAENEKLKAKVPARRP